MAGCVRVKTDQIGAGLGKGAGQRVDRLHHQVHINRHGQAGRRFGMGLERTANHRPEGQIRYVVVIHHIKMDPVAAGGNNAFHFFAQAGKV